MMARMTYIPRLTAMFLSVAWLVMGCVSGSQAVNGQNRGEAAKGGALFKIPDGYMQAPLSDFRGTMMLDPKKPAGMFVTYPNDNETTEALRQRLQKTIAPMFIHAEKGKAKPAISWTTQALPSHPGDGEGKAFANTGPASALMFWRRVPSPRKSSRGSLYFTAPP